jgi:hypothetical protein
MKPLLFIGCSSESLDIAYATQENLEDCTQPVVWTQGIFDLSRHFIESLLDILDESNFGLFVFAPDDLTKIRGDTMKTTRDNVIFELGLFIGHLGRDHTFIIMPKDIGELHLPSDLLGLNVAGFATPERPNLLVAALGPACNRVRRAIQEASPSSSGMGELGLALSLAVPAPQQKHMVNLAEGNTKGYKGCGSLRFELRNLVSMGLLEKQSDLHIGDIKSGITFDLAHFVKLTERGKRWVDRIIKSQ